MGKKRKRPGRGGTPADRKTVRNGARQISRNEDGTFHLFYAVGIAGSYDPEQVGRVVGFHLPQDVYQPLSLYEAFLYNPIDYFPLIRVFYLGEHFCGEFQCQDRKHTLPVLLIDRLEQVGDIGGMEDFQEVPKLAVRTRLDKQDQVV